MGDDGMDSRQPPAIDEYWQDGQDYRVGELLFKVIHCPGHIRAMCFF